MPTSSNIRRTGGGLDQWARPPCTVSSTHDPRCALDGGVVGHPLVGPLELLVALVPGLRPEHVADGRPQQELQHLVSRRRGWLIHPSCPTPPPGPGSPESGCGGALNSSPP